MAVELRPATAVLVLVVVLAAGSFGSVVVTEAGGAEADADAAVRVIPLEGDDRQLWLYTSRGYSFEEATLAINVVVYGDPEDVRQRLLEGGGSWNRTEADEQDVAPDETTSVVNATAVEWETADGADRYVFLMGVQSSLWLDEDYQVHDGTYLGSRHHVRAYTSPDDGGEWTAMQAHHEHWDWFMGRHIVTSVDESQAYVEQEFANGAGGPEIKRVPVGMQDSPGFDRWLTVIDFRSPASQSAAAVLLVVLGTVKARVGDVRATLRANYPAEDARTVFLATGMVGLLAFVRLTGVALERAVDVPPKVFAFALYPVLFAGLPVAAYLLARQLTRSRAFAGASGGFLAGVLVDYSYLGVTHVPLDVLVHRGALAVALGLVAVGSSRVERRAEDGPDHVRAGVLLWLVATVLPLLRHTPLPV